MQVELQEEIHGLQQIIEELTRKNQDREILLNHLLDEAGIGGSDAAEKLLACIAVGSESIVSEVVSQ